MEVTRCKSADEAKEKLADRVSAELRRHSENGIPVLFFFSGGSALSVLDMIDPECVGDFLTFAPIDERFDPSGETSNFSAFMRTDSFRKAESAGAHFIDTRVKEWQGIAELADQFERAIRKWMTDFAKEGRIIAILGMGPDGHTAGIFPDDDENAFRDRFDGDRLVVGYRAPEYATCPERVTVTLSFLQNHIDAAFVFLSGEEKCTAWERVLRNREPPHRLPAEVFHAIRKTEAFTDL